MLLDYVSSVEIALMYLEMIQFIVAQDEGDGNKYREGILKLKVGNLV